MGFIVVFILLAIVTIGLIVFGRIAKKKYPRDQYIWPTVVTWVGYSLTLLGAIVFGLNSFYTQDPGQAVIVKSFTGSIVTSTEEAGAHGKAPWDSTETFNIRNQRLEMFSNAGGEGADGAALNVPLKGGANATVSITVTYSINPSSVQDIYRDFQDQEGLRNNALKAKMRDVVRNETAKLAPLQIKENRAALGTSILESLTLVWDKYGITVDQVNLGDISLDASTEEAIAKVINAQQEVEQARANLEKAKITANVTKTEAKAQADADQIMRCGASTETIEVTDETTGKVTTEVQVTPIPMDKCQNRLNEQVLTNKYIDALKEIASKPGNVIITDGKTVPMVNVPTAAAK
jgi:regulator of protease activity HflC (stomatin/prohibitin superfamily)